MENCILYFTVPEADLTGIQKSTGKNLPQIWQAFCMINRLDPKQATLKVSEKDPRKAYLRNIKFRATKDVVAFLRVGLGARPANQVFFFGAAYKLKAKNNILLETIADKDLNYEHRGDGPSTNTN